MSTFTTIIIPIGVPVVGTLVWVAYRHPKDFERHFKKLYVLSGIIHLGFSIHFLSVYYTLLQFERTDSVTQQISASSDGVFYTLISFLGFGALLIFLSYLRTFFIKDEGGE